MAKFKVRIDAVFVCEVEAESAEAAKDMANDNWDMDDYIETGEILVFDEDGDLAEEGLNEALAPEWPIAAGDA